MKRKKDKGLVVSRFSLLWQGGCRRRLGGETQREWGEEEEREQNTLSTDLTLILSSLTPQPQPLRWCLPHSHMENTVPPA